MDQSILESTNLKLYKTLKGISAIIFHEIKFTGNVFLLDKDYDDKKNYNVLETSDISDAWSNLYDEYFEKSDDTGLNKTLRNKDSSLKLLITIKAIEDIVIILKEIDKNLIHMPKDAYLNIVSIIGNNLKRLHKNIKFDTTFPLPGQIAKIESIIGGLQTKYELKFKEDQQVDEEYKNYYYDLKANIESVLEKDYIPDHINMLQWMAYEKQYKVRLKSIRNKNNGSK